MFGCQAHSSHMETKTNQHFLHGKEATYCVAFNAEFTRRHERFRICSSCVTKKVLLSQQLSQILCDFWGGLWEYCGNQLKNEISWKWQSLHKHLQFTVAGKRAKAFHLPYSEANGNQAVCNPFCLLTGLLLLLVVQRTLACVTVTAIASCIEDALVVYSSGRINI